MFNPVAFLPDERRCANLLRKIRWTRYNRITCIYCHSQNIKKNGCYRSYQKFYCKCCKKNFNDKTDTIFHYSHTPLKKWFIVLYLFGLLERQDILEIGREVLKHRLLCGADIPKDLRHAEFAHEVEQHFTNFCHSVFSFTRVYKNRLRHNSICQLLLIIWYKASLQVSNVLVKNDQVHPKKASRNMYFRIHPD